MMSLLQYTSCGCIQELITSLDYQEVSGSTHTSHSYYEATAECVECFNSFLSETTLDLSTLALTQGKYSAAGMLQSVSLNEGGDPMH